MVATDNSIRAAEQLLRFCEGDAKMAAEMASGSRLTDALPATWQHNIVRNTRIAKLWRSVGRQTVAMHPGLVAEVSKASSSTFDLGIFFAIPYQNPMVVFAEPVKIKSWRAGAEPIAMAKYQEASMQFVGFFVHGSRTPCFIRTPNGDTRWLTPQEQLNPPKDSDVSQWLDRIATDTLTTHDPEANTLGISAIFDVLDPTGKRVDGECASFSIPLTGTSNLKDLVAAQVKRFNFAFESQRVEQEAWIAEVYRIIVGCLLYLCSTTLDAERVPASATRRFSKTIARKPLSMYRVGWTIGAALSRYRQSRIGEGSQQGDISHQQDPQHRKCHFRMQWYGPRNAIPCQLMRGTCPCDGRHREWIFIAPYWTHVERLGQTGVNTVRRTKK